MTTLPRLLKPSRTVRSSKVLLTPAYTHTSPSPTRARKDPTRNVRSPCRTTRYDHVEDCQALEATFLGWLSQASQLQAHDQSCLAQQASRLPPSHPRRRLRRFHDCHRANAPYISSSIRRYSAAAAAASIEHDNVDWQTTVGETARHRREHEVSERWPFDRLDPVAGSKLESRNNTQIRRRNNSVGKALSDLPGEREVYLGKDQKGYGWGRVREETNTHAYGIEPPKDRDTRDNGSTTSETIHHASKAGVDDLVTSPERLSLRSEKLGSYRADDNISISSMGSAALTPAQQAHADRVRAFPLASRLSPLHEESNRQIGIVRSVLRPVSRAARMQRHSLKVYLAKSPGLVSPDVIWSCFEELPEPQVHYMSTVMVNQMFAHLAMVDYHHRNEASQRVDKLYKQCMAADVTLSTHAWTTAVQFAGLAKRRVDKQNVQNAVEIWMQMEQRGVQPDRVTLNVLYQVAAKGQRFALAESFLDEIKARGFPFDRYLRCSMIYTAGLQGDVEAIRTHFIDLVRAGELVDTAVMNCVMKALILAGDGEGAESTFESMKALKTSKFVTEPIRAWQDRRQLARHATQVYELIRKQQEEHKGSFFGGSYADKDRLESLQMLSPVGPDEASFRLIIGYHALVTGDIESIQRLMMELLQRGGRHHGSTYQRIFHGFALHGGTPDTLWTGELLEHIWSDFCTSLPPEGPEPLTRLPRPIRSAERASSFFAATTKALRNGVDKASKASEQYRFQSNIHFTFQDELSRPAYLSIPMAKSILRAFQVCCGKKRMKRANMEIRARWPSISTEERTILWEFVNKLKSQDDAHVLGRSIDLTDL